MASPLESGSQRRHGVNREPKRFDNQMRVLLFANTDWYLFNFRLSLAQALQSAGHHVTLVAPPGEFDNRFACLGLRFVPFPFDRRSINPCNQMSAVVKLASLYRRERPDLAHHFTIKCAVYGSLAARLAGVPGIVNALTGLGSVFVANDRHSRYLRLLVRQSLRASLADTEVIVQNPHDREMLERTRVAAPERISLIRGSGVDLDKFKPSKQWRNGACRVLFASRLLKTKGVFDFEEVAWRLRPVLPKAEFLVAGAPDPGNPDTLTAETLNAMRDRGHVRMLGHIDRMENLLAEVDIVVLPTRYGEGVPRILVEAAACGLPLIATDAPGCREIVVPRSNGSLVPPGDVDALTAAVRELLENRATREAMGAQSRLVAAAFATSQVVDETVQVYRRALRRRPELLP